MGLRSPRLQYLAFVAQALLPMRLFQSRGPQTWGPHQARFGLNRVEKPSPAIPCICGTGTLACAPLSKSWTVGLGPHQARFWPEWGREALACDTLHLWHRHSCLCASFKVVDRRRPRLRSNHQPTETYSVTALGSGIGSPCSLMPSR